MTDCYQVRVSGRVQGVGFRYHTQRQAQQLGITGWVRNLSDGTVEALICGNEQAVNAMLAWLRHGPSMADVSDLEILTATDSNSYTSFDITG